MFQGRRQFAAFPVEGDTGTVCRPFSNGTATHPAAPPFPAHASGGATEASGYTPW